MHQDGLPLASNSLGLFGVPATAGSRICLHFESSLWQCTGLCTGYCCPASALQKLPGQQACCSWPTRCMSLFKAEWVMLLLPGLIAPRRPSAQACQSMQMARSWSRMVALSAGRGSAPKSNRLGCALPASACHPEWTAVTSCWQLC